MKKLESFTGVYEKFISGKVINEFGVVVQCGIELENLIIANAENAKLIEKSGKEIRILLRAQDNLRNCTNILENLIDLRKNPPRKIGFDSQVEHALFSLAVMTYGSCFVKGENNRKPLDWIDTRLTSSAVHVQLRNFRDKLFAHIDANHEVRSDHLIWYFSTDKEVLIPKFGGLIGEKSIFPEAEFIENWMQNCRYLSSLVNEEILKINSSINQILNKVYLVKEKEE